MHTSESRAGKWERGEMSNIKKYKIQGNSDYGTTGMGSEPNFAVTYSI